MSNSSTIPPDKDTLLQRIQAAYSAADQLLARIPPDITNTPGVCGSWSVKDLVAHLTAWEKRTLRWIEEAEGGIPLTVPEPGFGWDQFDALNAVAHEQNRDWDYDAIRRDFRETQHRILATVAHLTDADLRGEGRMAGMFSDSPAEAIAANTYEHYVTHLAQISDWLANA